MVTVGGGRASASGQRTRFVGRDRDIQRIGEILASARLLTLVGPGGSGKTRLAMETADRAAGPGDRWRFVNLAPVAEGRLVPEAFADAFDVAEQPRRSRLSILVDLLADQEVLLVVDNCEHVIDAAAEVVDRLLNSCPGVRVLGTSRQPLNVAGEFTWQVPGLTSAEATELFVDRARQASGFNLTEENQEDVAQLCVRLDGLPLAIELAAANSRVLAPRQIAELLERTLQLPAASVRATPRQQTLEATIEWSYRLLTDDEAELFRRLSVYVGGFDLEGAQAISDTAVLAPLSSLVDKSLVVADDERRGRTKRYRLLETLRQFATPRLESTQDADRVRRRQALHLIGLAERASARVRRGERGGGLARLRSEQDNLRAALEWSRTQPDDIGLRLATSLGLYWVRSASVREGSEWLADRLSAPVGDSGLRATALFWLASLLWRHREYEGARRALETSLEIKRGLNDAAGIVRRLRLLAWVAMAKGDSASVERICGEALGFLDNLTDPQSVADVYMTLSCAELVANDAAAALRHTEEAGRRIESTANARTQDGDIYWMANATGVRMLVDVERGDLRSARANLARTLRLVSEQLDWRDAEPGWIWCSVVLAEAEGRDRDAVRMAGVIAALDERGVRWNEALEQRYQAAIERARERLGRADAERLFAEGRGLTFEAAVLQGLDALKPGAGPLSGRELEVARLIGAGLGNVEIAERLYLSKRTVESHVEHIKQKLGLTARTEIRDWMGAQQAAG